MERFPVAVRYLVLFGMLCLMSVTAYALASEQSDARSTEATADADRNETPGEMVVGDDGTAPPKRQPPAKAETLDPLPTDSQSANLPMTIGSLASITPPASANLEAVAMRGAEVPAPASSKPAENSVHAPTPVPSKPAENSAPPSAPTASKPEERAAPVPASAPATPRPEEISPPAPAPVAAASKPDETAVPVPPAAAPKPDENSAAAIWARIHESAITDVRADISLPSPQGKPEDKQMPDRPENVSWTPRMSYAMRQPLCYFWDAPALYYNPLYFEESNLERHGYSPRYLRLFQPVVSGAQFFATIPTLPYQMAATPPCECVYTLGEYRPGSCVPYQINRPPLSAAGGLSEAGTAIGLIMLIP